MLRFLAPLVLACLLAAPGAASAQEERTETYKDWTLRCPAERTPPCVLHQRLVNEEQNQLLEVVIDYRPADNLHTLLLELPLGIFLPAGAAIVIDETKEFPGLRLSRCLAGGCLVEDQASAELLAAMRAGQKASVVVGMPDGRKLAIVFSLQGFTAALAALDQANAQ